MNRVEGFLKVDEDHVYVGILLIRLFNDISEDEKSFYCPKPACCSRRSLSIVSLSLMNMGLSSILAGIGMRVRPLQYPRLVRSPFFCNLIINPSIYSLFHISLNKVSSFALMKSIYAFRTSLVMQSVLAALLFLRFSLALVVSSSVMYLVSISSSFMLLVVMLALISGSCLFNTSVKCSFHSFSFCG